MKWHFRTSVLVIAFLCVGPLALPLVWINPRFSRAAKIIITLIMIILSYCLWIMFVKSLKSMEEYYDFLKQLSRILHYKNPPRACLLAAFSRMQASEGPHGQIRREFGRLCGVSPLEIAQRFQGLGPGNASHFSGQILLDRFAAMHKIVRTKPGITLRSQQNPHRILLRNPFGANFACPTTVERAKNMQNLGLY
jgi:hypothetical protein